MLLKILLIYKFHTIIQKVNITICNVLGSKTARLQAY